MLSVEYAQYAPSYLKIIMKDHHLDNAKAYAAFSMDDGLFPSTRDRTEEMVKAVKGMADATDVKIIDFTGRDLCRFYNALYKMEYFNRKFRFVFA